MKLSTIILTFNSEAVLAETLESVKGVSDAIHIVDSFSTDGTLAIAARYGAQVVQHAFEDYGTQRNWAIENLPIDADWELHLDADERLTLELAAEINALKQAAPAGVDGFYLPRLACFLGRPIRHGGMYPTWHLRLFRRGSGRCERRLYDQHFFVTGLTDRLRHPMIDDQRHSLSEWTARHNRWSDAEVKELGLGVRSGVIAARMTGTPVERKRAYRGWYYRAPPLLRAFLLFFYRYLLRLGFLDGKEGLIFFVLQTFWFRFLIDAKLYEAAAKGPTDIIAATGSYDTGRRQETRSEDLASAQTNKKSA